MTVNECFVMKIFYFSFNNNVLAHVNVYIITDIPTKQILMKNSFMLKCSCDELCVG